VAWLRGSKCALGSRKKFSGPRSIESNLGFLPGDLGIYVGRDWNAVVVSVALGLANCPLDHVSTIWDLSADDLEFLLD
jgi:hypothetical protein